MNYDKLILVHNGALGDFLTVWPALWALRQCFSTLPLFWAGRDERETWLAPLAIASATHQMRAAIKNLYQATTLPPALDAALVVWFGLDRKPFPLVHDNVWFVPTVDRASFEPPTVVAARGLARRGIAWRQDWLAAWRERCGAWQAAAADPGRVLLFAGAGHRAKQWPLVRFTDLARRLAATGQRPVFVLGPAEIERRLDPGPDGPWTIERCDSASCLTELLLGAGMAVGNDCGPMHLAGYLGVPCLALFGPTAAQQWSPPAARTLSLDIACRPCTKTTRELDCTHPQCLEALEVEIVEQACLELLRMKGTGP